MKLSKIKVIIAVKKMKTCSNKYIFESNERSYIFYRNEVQLLIKEQEEKKELIEVLGVIKEAVDDGCISDAQLILDTILQKYSEEK